MMATKKSVCKSISLKRKILASLVGGFLFTFFVTWFLLGLILSFFGVDMGSLPIPYWDGTEINLVFSFLMAYFGVQLLA